MVMENGQGHGAVSASDTSAPAGEPATVIATEVDTKESFTVTEEVLHSVAPESDEKPGDNDTQPILPLNVEKSVHPKPSLPVNINSKVVSKPFLTWRLPPSLMWFLFLVVSAFCSIAPLAVPVFFLARLLLGIHLSRLAVTFIFGNWLAMYPFLAEKICRTKVVVCGEPVPQANRIILLANHRTEVDWVYLWNLAYRKGRIGQLRFALKATARNVPLFGWAFYCLEFLLLDRKWDLDQSNIQAWVDSFKDPRDPLWMVLFPEGTDFSQKKCVKSQEYAREHGGPLLHQVLLPRVKGFHALFGPLRDSLEAVVDVTIAYKPRPPSILEVFAGHNPEEVHMHTRILPLDEIPDSEDEMTAWMFRVFQEKDALLHQFQETGAFPNSDIEGPLSFSWGLVSICVFVGLTVLVLWAMVSYMWYRTYVLASCVVLLSATYMRWKPVPVFSFPGYLSLPHPPAILE